MMNDDRFTKIRSTIDSKVFSNSLTNFTDKHVRKTNSEENRAEYEEKVSRDGIKSRKPSALGYIYGYRPRRRRRGEDQEEDQEEGGGTNSKSGRRSTKPQDDKDAQKTWETNGTGMKLIGQQIKKLLIK